MKNKIGGASGDVLSPRTKKAGKKLFSAMKTKKLRKEFKKTQTLLNTRSHRMGNNLKVNSGNLLGKQFEYFFNPDLIDDSSVVTISNPGDSASGSVVMLFKSKKTNHRYVLKVTGVIREQVVNAGRPLNFPEIECQIYKEVSKLVKNITPHTFTLVNNLLNIKRDTLPDNNYFKLNGIDTKRTYFSVLLNETSSADSELRTLSDFIYYYLNNYTEEKKMKLLNNILFQIIYTLEVFNRVGIMHNDLHTGNLFIVMNNNRFDRPNYRKTFKNYRFKSTDGTQYSVKLENIGYEVRIYDYDRSYKFPKPGTLFPGYKSTELIRYYFQDINHYHAEQNPYFDTFKILSHLYNNHLTDLPVEFIMKIRSFFNEKTLLNDGVVGQKDFLFSDRMKKYLIQKNYLEAAKLREYFLINSKPIGYMKTTEEILVDLATDPEVLLHISGAEPHIPVIETYDMDGINKDLLESDKKSNCKRIQKNQQIL